MKSEDSTYRYWAFVSYSSKNKRWGRWVHRAIEAYGIPAQLVNRPTPSGQPAPKRFRPIFRDREELPASTDLGADIGRALRSSRYLIVVCSRDAAQSEWVNKEIENFQALGRNDRILAIIVDGQPHAGNERECFPPALRSCDPVAADARPEGDGKANAKLKLLAGMLGVNFDVLKQRDSRRRVRRMQILLSISLLITTLFASLAWYANRQRSAAVEQRRVAVNRLVDLRKLISAMMWEMVDSLDNEEGTLTIKKALLIGSEAYLSKLKEENPADKGLLRELALTYGKMGDTLFAQGRLEDSLVNYKNGLDLSKRLMELDNTNAMYLFDVIDGNLGLAQAMISRGQLTEAKMQLLTSLGSLKEYTLKIAGQRPAYLSLAKVHMGLFDVYTLQGKADEARWHLEKSIEAYELLTEQAPNSAEISVGLAGMYTRFARVLRDVSDHADAAYYARKGVALCSNVLEDMPAYKPAKLLRASGYLELAKSLLGLNEDGEAMHQVQQGENDLKTLMISEPDWTASMQLLAETYMAKAEILDKSGKLKESIDILGEAKLLAEEVRSLDSTNISATMVSARAHGRLALDLHQLGQQANFRSSLSIFEGLNRSLTAGEVKIGSDLERLADQLEKLRITQ